MSSVVRSVLGAALLVTGASAAMAQSANQTALNQPLPAGAYSAAPASGYSAAPAASNNAAPGAYATVAAANTGAPVVEQSTPKPHSNLCDNTDRYGGHGPETRWGTRAFWDSQGNAN
jgi:hypothetical protein